RLAQGDLVRLGRRRDIEAVQAVARGDLGFPRPDLLGRQVLVGIAPGVELLLTSHGVSLAYGCVIPSVARDLCCSAKIPRFARDDTKCAQVAYATGLPLPLICVRCMMRRAAPSNGSRRCMVERLSHITRSPSRQTCSYRNCGCVQWAHRSSSNASESARD